MSDDPDFIDETGEEGVPPSAAQLGASNRSLESITQRIVKAVRFAGGYSAVADKPGLPGRTLSRLLAGQEPKVSQLIDLAAATFVRPEWLTLGVGPMQAAAGGLEEASSSFTAGGDLTAPADSVAIPRYEARASAGIGTTLDPGWAIEKVLFPADFIRNKLRRNPAHLALIECAGDSMEPALRDGDELLIDTSATDPRSGPIYILRLNGILLAKRIQPRFDGTIMILSDNPRYPPEAIKPSESTPLDVVGEVVWRSGSMRF